MDFDIHGGGSDLIFPHHENEIAQTEAARGKPLARLWMHNGMVEMGDEKMAKSVGNIRLLHGALDAVRARRVPHVDWSARHYRQPLAYTEEALADAGARGRARARADPAPATPRRPTPAGAGRDRGALLRRRWPTTSTRRRPAPRCSSWVAEANRRLDAGERLGPGPARRDAARVRAREPARRRRRAGRRTRSSAWRPSARRRAAARDFERADRLRDELAARGWEIRDTRGRPPAGAHGDRLRAQPRARGAARAPARCTGSTRPSGAPRGLARATSTW